VTYLTDTIIESICFSFEKLKLDQQEMGLTKDHQLDIVWLRESNEKLRKDVLKASVILLLITDILNTKTWVPTTAYIGSTCQWWIKPYTKRNN
jgi:hypothetical protein